MRQSFFADMGGVRLQLEDDEFRITSKQIFALHKLDLIKLDTLNPAAIDDRSKADGVAELFKNRMIPYSEPRTFDAAHRHHHPGAEHYSVYSVYGYQPHVVGQAERRVRSHRAQDRLYKRRSLDKNRVQV